MEILIALLNAAILFIWAKALISDARPEKKPAKRRELNEKFRNKTSRRKTRTRSCPRIFRKRNGSRGSGNISHKRNEKRCGFECVKKPCGSRQKARKKTEKHTTRRKNGKETIK